MIRISNTGGWVATIFATLAILVLFTATTSAQCETATDQKLVADMYAKIKADKSLASQIRHINVSSLYLVIKLQGYTDRKTDRDRLVGYAMKMPCVKMVNSNDLSPTPPDSATGGTNQRLAGGGCASGMKQCGDICIPEGDVCNIESFLGLNYDPLEFLNISDYGIVAACGMY